MLIVQENIVNLHSPHSIYPSWCSGTLPFCAANPLAQKRCRDQLLQYFGFNVGVPPGDLLLQVRPNSFIFSWYGYGEWSGIFQCMVSKWHACQCSGEDGGFSRCFSACGSYSWTYSGFWHADLLSPTQSENSLLLINCYATSIHTPRYYQQFVTTTIKLNARILSASNTMSSILCQSPCHLFLGCQRMNSDMDRGLFGLQKMQRLWTKVLQF